MIALVLVGVPVTWLAWTYGIYNVIPSNVFWNYIFNAYLFCAYVSFTLRIFCVIGKYSKKIFVYLKKIIDEADHLECPVCGSSKVGPYTDGSLFVNQGIMTETSRGALTIDKNVKCKECGEVFSHMM